MNMLKTIGLVASVWTMSCGVSQATVLDFQGPADGTVINNLFAGVTFGSFGPDLTGAPAGPSPLAALPVPTNDVIIANPGGSFASLKGAFSSGIGPGVGDGGILMTFAQLQSTVSLVGFDGGSDLDDMTLTAFDNAGAVLGSAFFDTLTSSTGPHLINGSISFAGMRHVAFTFGNSNGFFGIDDLEFAFVPEPATLLLVGLGLTVAGFRKRRV